MTDFIIASECPDKPEILALLAASDRYHAALYPAESNHLVDITSLMAGNVRFLVARHQDRMVAGCGAIFLGMNEGVKTAELKRMWVTPATRGSGLGRLILNALEAQAISESATIARLETGIHQPEALGLYRAAGYQERGPFGAYQEDPLSVFMEKSIKA